MASSTMLKEMVHSTPHNPDRLINGVALTWVMMQVVRLLHTEGKWKSLRLMEIAMLQQLGTPGAITMGIAIKEAVLLKMDGRLAM